MKFLTKRLGLTVAVLGLMAASAEPARANLVLNGGFESGDLTDWSSDGGHSVQGVAFFTHTGNFGLGYGAIGSASPLYQTIKTTAGATYIFDFWQKQKDTSVGTEFAAYWNGTQILHMVNKPADNLWTHYSFNVIATGSTTEIKFALRQDKGGSALDDVSVVEADTIATPEPSSIALVCTAIPMGLGLAWKRRRKAAAA